MNTRIVTSLAMAVLAALATSCARQATVTASVEPATTAPGMRYEAHVNAGGAAPPSLPLPARPASSASDSKSGEQLFYSMNCDGCHGGGASGDVGPSLIDGRWRYGGADEEVFQSIFYGRPKGMPAFGGVLGANGVWMIVAYLQAQPVPDIVPTTNYDDLMKPAPAPASTTPAASVAPEPRPSTDPRAQVAQYGCTGCHAIDKKVVGPAFRDVAAKYHGDSSVAPRLEAKVKNGGGGVWGDIPMPPNTAVPDADLRGIVNWILTSPDVRK
jgi:cytochrome c